MIGETTGESYSPETAFAVSLTSDTAFLGEQPLAKFSLSRKIAAQAMSCMAPASFTPGAYAAFKKTLQYPGVHNDVINILWLCTLKDKIDTAAEYRAGAFTPDRAINQPADAVAAARAWAETAKLDEMANPEYQDAWKIFLRIVFAIDTSLFALAEDESKGPPPRTPPKARPGHPKSRSSSRGSPGKPTKPARSSGKK